MGLRQFQSVPRIHILNRPQNFNFQNPCLRGAGEWGILAHVPFGRNREGERKIDL